MGLLLALGLCWCLLGAAATEPHSLDILITGLNELDGTHRFFMLAKLDGLELASYSSDSREVKPLREWVAQAVGTSYLRKKTQEFRLYEAISRVVTHRWMAQHNQTGGIHTLQLHVNCVLNGDTPVRGQFHFAFDGQDYLILERNQSAWVPLALEASNETHFWDAGHTWTLFAREFLQEECVDTLRSLLRGGMEALGRQVPPGMSVTYSDAPQGSAILCCHARGFYPRPIHISWVRDGAEILPPVNASGILPHANGTYQIRQSLEIPQRWGHSYACRVAHSSLGEPVPTIALPEVSVSRRDSPDGSATLSCRARGFDPRPIRVSWVRDGKETPAPPISDASQLQRSVGIPQQGGAGHSYSCRVQPHGLQETLATPAPGEMGGLAPGIVAALCLAVLTGSGAVASGVVVWRRKHPAPPEVSVSRRDTPDGSVTLSCRARGFYPRPIHVSWVRDGEDILAKMDSSGILSNADNTYYTPLSLEISLQQQDGHRYACRVEHSSRGEPTFI
ncbi:major histocompatibility complex class I-related gene protein-like [Chelonoidis abingdonii]|uniref:major histocompatibility complex class I-related gene protein-like n=1 Tax=Chelonoidis abingdonii TaxID=106734 RepID=UPI003F494CF2